MVQLGIGRKHHQIASLANTKAEIGIIEPNDKLFVVTAHFVEHRPLHHLARAGNGGKIPRTNRTRLIARPTRREELMSMDQSIVWAHQHTGMLNQAILEIELRTHNAHLWPLQISKHLLNTIRGNNLGVVVQKQQMLALGKPGAVVDKRRIVEALFPPNNLHPARVLPLQMGVNLFRPRLLAPIFNQNNLYFLVGTAK